MCDISMKIMRKAALVMIGSTKEKVANFVKKIKQTIFFFWCSAKFFRQQLIFSFFVGC